MDFVTISNISAKAHRWNALPDAFNEHLSQFSYGSSIDKVLKFLVNPDAPLPNIPLAAADVPLHADLENLRELVNWESRLLKTGKGRRRLGSSVETEILLKVSSVKNWTNISLLNHILLKSIRPTKRTAVVTTMRDDGASIIEWVAHYVSLGFEGIFVYSNDNEDKSDVLLEILADNGIITYINNEISGIVSPQRKAFEHSIRMLPELRDYEWAFYADSDEFLMLPVVYDHKISNVLDSLYALYGNILPSAICYHWRWYVSGNAYQKTEGVLLERFQHSRAHTLFKSIIRLRDAVSMRLLHFPEAFPEAFFVDSTLSAIPESKTDGQLGMWQYKTPNYAGGQLNHYWHKSFYEYFLKKRKGDQLANKELAREFNLFFDWNAAETSENFDPVPSMLLERVRQQMLILRNLPGVVDAEADIQQAQDEIIKNSGGDTKLHSIYRACLKSTTTATTPMPVTAYK